MCISWFWHRMSDKPSTTYSPRLPDQAIPRQDGPVSQSRQAPAAYWLSYLFIKGLETSSCDSGPPRFYSQVGELPWFMFMFYSNFYMKMWLVIKPTMVHVYMLGMQWWTSLCSRFSQFLDDHSLLNFSCLFFQATPTFIFVMFFFFCSIIEGIFFLILHASVISRLPVNGYNMQTTSTVSVNLIVSLFSSYKLMVLTKRVC